MYNVTVNTNLIKSDGGIRPYEDQQPIKLGAKSYGYTDR